MPGSWQLSSGCMKSCCSPQLQSSPRRCQPWVRQVRLLPRTRRWQCGPCACVAPRCSRACVRVQRRCLQQKPLCSSGSSSRLSWLRRWLMSWWPP